MIIALQIHKDESFGACANMILPVTCDAKFSDYPQYGSAITLTDSLGHVIMVPTRGRVELFAI